MNLPGIEIDPDRCGGAPVIRGTRVTISQLLAELADGDSVDQIADDMGLDRDAMTEALRTLAREVPDWARRVFEKEDA